MPCRPSPTLLIEVISRLSRLEMMDGLEKIFLPMFRAGVQIVLLEDGSKYDAIRMQDGSVPTASELWASCYGEGPWMLLPIEPRDMKLIEMQQRIEQLQAQLEKLSNE